MAKEMGQVGQGQSHGGADERTKKAAITRKLTAEKRSKLGAREAFAYDKIGDCVLSLDRLRQHVLSGGNVSPQLLASIADLDREIGNSMFA